MNLPYPLLLAALLTSAVFGFAQTAPSTPEAKESEAVKLDPFNVNADADVGFVAATSLAGGRMATALKDTPVAYSVITKEFIDAFNVTDVVEAAQWSTNANQNETDQGTRMYGRSSVEFVRTRGIKMGLPTRNFFTISSTSDSYNLDRVDMARGPNSVLFGAGGVAGTMNSMTKQAEPARKFSEVQIKLGSFNHYRFTADINQPITSKIALRLNLLYDEGDTWRAPEYNEKRGFTVAAKYNVTTKFSIRAEFEYRKLLDGTLNTSMRDNISGWDGTTTFGAYPGNNGTPIAMTPTQLAVAGLSTAEPQRFVTSPDWGDVFMNFQGRYQSKAAAQNNTLTLTNRINGVPIITQGFSLVRAAWADAADGIPTDRWNRALAGSPYFRLPDRHDTGLWTDRSLPGAFARGTDASLYFNYTPTDSLYFEVAGNQSVSKQYGENTQRRGLIDFFLEVNRTLPDGSPNPGFLKNYLDVYTYRTHKDYTLSQVRAQGVYKKETRFGRLQFSVITGYNKNETYAFSQNLFLPLTSLAPDARSWTDVSNETSEYGAWTRWYLNDGSARIWRDWSNTPARVYNPVNGLTESVTPRWMFDPKKQDNNYLGFQTFKFGQAAGNLDLFKNRSVLIGAFRRDLTSIYTKRVPFPGDMPVGWDGSTLGFLNDAPADYYQLTYLAKDATGKVTDPNPQPATSRPRGRAVTTVTGDRANVGLPQYAGDRFQDDYNVPEYRKAVNTHTYGAVVNVTRWLGVYGNASTTFNLTPPAQRVDGSLVPPSASYGKDYGIRMNLPGNRLAISIGRFTSYQDGATLRASTGSNNIAAAPAVGDLTASGRNIRGFKTIPGDTYSTRTDSTEGYEFEMTANLTPTWRLILNAGYTDAVSKNEQPDIIAWYPKNDAIMRQVLGDAGVLIDSNKHASINPAVNDPTKINQAKVQAAVDAWNTIQEVTIPNLSGQSPRMTGGNIKWLGNIATDFRFRSGPLKGLRLGGGVNYRGGQAIAYKGSDTIRDPNNPNGAIPDPAGGALVPVIASGYYKGVLTMSYTVRLKEVGRRLAPKTIQFDLNVDNLFNRQDVVYGSINDIVQTSNTFFRPRVGEDITSPARRTVPGAFGYLPPRNYTVSAKLGY